MTLWGCDKCGTFNTIRPDQDAMIMIPLEGYDYCKKCGWNPNEKRYIANEYRD